MLERAFLVVSIIVLPSSPLPAGAYPPNRLRTPSASPARGRRVTS